MSMQTKTIGRMPTDHGPYDPQLAYGKKFQCTLFGCAWESLHDNNNTAPAVWDGGDVITPNLVDWKKVSGSYEAWLMNKDKPATTGTTGAYPYNGMGRVVLKKNIVDGVNTLTHEAFEDSEGNDRENTIYVIQYDFTVEGTSENISLNFTSLNVSGVMTPEKTELDAAIVAYVDNPTPENLKRKQRAQAAYEAIGSQNYYYWASYTIPAQHCLHLTGRAVRLNDPKNAQVATEYNQGIIYAPSNESLTVYVGNLAGQYSYLKNGYVKVPANCVIEFDGGSIKGNGENKNTITGNSTHIVADVEYVFKNIILGGTYTNDYIYIEQFGIITGSANAVTNGDIFTNCIIPSCDITNIGLKSLKGNEYYVSDALAFNGEYDVLIPSQLIYTGTGNATFITIGTPSEHAHFRKKFSINIKQDANPAYVLDSESGLYTIPENYGVKFVDVSFCEIEVWVDNFAYAVSLLALSPVGVVDNKFNRVYVRGKFYCGLQYKSTNQGWINENVVFDYHNYVVSSNILRNTHQVIGICIDASDEGHEESAEYSIFSSNNNVFIKPCVESTGIGVLLKNARYNTFIALRNEAVYKTLVTDVTASVTGKSQNNIVLTCSETGKTGQDYVKNDALGNCCFNINELGKFTNVLNIPIKYVKDSAQYKRTSCEIFKYDREMGTTVSSGPVFGFVFDVRNEKIWKIATNANRIYVRMVTKSDNSYSFISGDISGYLINGTTPTTGEGYSYFSYPKAAKEVVLTFTDTAQYAFIGIYPSSDIDLTNMYISYAIKGDTPIELLIEKTGFMESIATAPTDTVNYKIGDMLFINGVPCYWNGTAWVDSHGNAAGTVYPKVIGTPTTGNIAKFNGTDIEDAGTAPQV